jgi:hypothetical protein
VYGLLRIEAHSAVHVDKSPAKRFAAQTTGIRLASINECGGVRCLG